MMSEATKPLAAATAEEANEVIHGLLKECVEGVSDREGEALTLASEWGIDEEGGKGEVRQGTGRIGEG